MRKCGDSSTVSTERAKFVAKVDRIKKKELIMEAGIYEHYKGGLYLYDKTFEHHETGKKYVGYIALTGAHLPGMRARIRELELEPGVDAWNDMVVWPDGIVRQRFVYVGEQLSEAMLEKYKDAGWKQIDIGKSEELEPKRTPGSQFNFVDHFDGWDL